MRSRIGLFFGFGLLLALGCGGNSTDDDSTSVQRYEVDGVVARLPGGPGTEFMIEHEEIPDFVNANGDTVGMNAMTMGFPLDEDVSLEGLAAGDSVHFAFEVRWGASPPLRLTQIEKR